MIEWVWPWAFLLLPLPLLIRLLARPMEQQQAALIVPSVASFQPEDTAGTALGNRATARAVVSVPPPGFDATMTTNVLPEKSAVSAARASAPRAQTSDTAKTVPVMPGILNLMGPSRNCSGIEN